MKHAILAILTVLCAMTANALAASLALTGVTVIDTQGGPSQPAMTVVIAGDRIAAVGKADSVTIPAGARQVDARGKFLIPGLWDMHVHAGSDSTADILIAHGVTGIRGFGPMTRDSWQRLAAEGRSAPRLVSTRGWNTVLPPGQQRGDRTPDQGREAVRRIKAQGYDFVKVHDVIPRDLYFALADEARKQGIRFMGHLSFGIRATEAVEAGQHTIEHLYPVLIGCSSKEEELLPIWPKVKGDFNENAALAQRLDEQLIATYDSNKAASLFAKFRSRGTWHCPTLIVHHALAHMDELRQRNDPLIDSLPFGVREAVADWSRENFQHRKELFQRLLQLVGDMHRSGVGFLAGTDTGPYGQTLHRELQLLAQAGLTPLAALQTATLNPAKYLDRLKDLGTVESGKLADLVLLDADPLKDIGNTRQIAAVLVNGKLLPKEMLRKMLDDAARPAKPKE